MPSPVLALPCGSRSIIRTLLPQAASAVPRLMAVVVWPTPPFWFAIATTRPSCGALRLTTRRTANSLKLQEDAPRSRPAWHDCALHMPALPGLGQFIQGGLALEEQAEALAGEKPRGQLEQPRQGRQRAGGHHIGRQLELLDAAGMDHDRRLGDTGGLAQELRLALVALDQLHARNAEQRQDEAWQARAAAEIEHGSGRARHMLRDLAAVQ